MFVLQDIDTTTSNTSNKCEWPNLRAFRAVLRDRWPRATSYNCKQNVGRKQEVVHLKRKKHGIFPNRSSASNANQTCSTLLSAAPRDTMIQPNPHRQCVEITAVRLFNEEVPSGIYLHGRGLACCRANSLGPQSTSPIRLRVQDLVQLLETLHSCAWWSHNQHVRFAKVDVIEEVRIALGRIQVEADHNIKVCTSNIATSNK